MLLHMLSSKPQGGGARFRTLQNRPHLQLLGEGGSVLHPAGRLEHQLAAPHAQPAHQLLLLRHPIQLQQSDIEVRRGGLQQAAAGCLEACR